MFKSITLKSSTMLLLAATFAAGALLSSCTQKDVLDPEQERGQVISNPESGILVTFKATQADRPASKTVIEEDGKIKWDSSEDISLFYGAGSGAKFSWSGTPGETYESADFTGLVDSLAYGDSSRRYVAVYPYSAENYFDGESVTVTLPNVQTAVAGSFADDLFIMLAQSEDYFLPFYHLCGGVRFSITEPDVRSVTFKSNGGQSLAGKVRVNFDDYSGKPYVEEVIESETELTLVPPDSGSFETGKWYYIVSLPATLYDGYTLMLDKGDGTTAARTNLNWITIERAVWGQLTEADASLEYGILDEIRYTSREDSTGIMLYGDFGANIVSNTYENGEWIIKFDGPVTRIGNYAFENCSGLTSITLPPSVTRIGYRAFENCSGLTSITLPSSVTSIYEDAFYGCSNLSAFNSSLASEDRRCLVLEGELRAFAPAGISAYEIPSSVTRIGNYAFNGCSGLTDITVSSSVTRIGSGAFGNCSSLRGITIPDSVTDIESWAFEYCSSLESIVIPSSVTTIESRLFAGCSSLKNITIPESVEYIGNQPFYGCSSLETFKGKFASEDGRCLILEGELRAFAPAGINAYEIPSSVTRIGNYAFNGCSSLTNITIPESVKSIGDWAFSNCANLNRVYVQNVTPSEISWGTFNDCPRLSAIFVPDESIDAYRSAEGWSEYEKLFRKASEEGGSAIEDTEFRDWE